MADQLSNDATSDTPEFDIEQQQIMVEIGQALIGQSTGGTVAVDLVVTRQPDGESGDLDVRLELHRQSGLTVPAAADEALVDAVQRLVLLWDTHGRDPWRVLTYRLTRGKSGPRYTSEFSF